MSMYPHHRQATSNFALRRGYIVSPNTSIVASKSASHYRNVLDINPLSSQQVDTSIDFITKSANHYEQLRPINNDGYNQNYSLPLSQVTVGNELLKPQVQCFGQPNDNYKTFSTSLSQSENLSQLLGMFLILKPKEKCLKRKAHCFRSPKRIRAARHPN
jgi:hypothetical protein